MWSKRNRRNEYGIDSAEVKIGVLSADDLNAMFGGEIFMWGKKNAKKPRLVPEISRVIYNDPATIILWSDGTKTVAKVSNTDKYNPETGLMACICRKALGNNKQFKATFKDWLPETDGTESSFSNVQMSHSDEIDTIAGGGASI